MKAHEQFTIILKQSSAAGYLWQIVEDEFYNIAYKEIKKNILIPDAREVVGGAVDVTWTFEALTDKPFTVTIEYKRPWEVEASSVKKYKYNQENA